MVGDTHSTFQGRVLEARRSQSMPIAVAKGCSRPVEAALTVPSSWSGSRHLLFGEPRLCPKTRFGEVVEGYAVTQDITSSDGSLRSLPHVAGFIAKRHLRLFAGALARVCAPPGASNVKVGSRALATVGPRRP